MARSRITAAKPRSPAKHIEPRPNCVAVNCLAWRIRPINLDDHGQREFRDARGFVGNRLPALPARRRPKEMRGKKRRPGGRGGDEGEPGDQYDRHYSCK